MALDDERIAVLTIAGASRARYRRARRISRSRPARTTSTRSARPARARSSSSPSLRDYVPADGHPDRRRAAARALRRPARRASIPPTRAPRSRRWSTAPTSRRGSRRARSIGENVVLGPGVEIGSGTYIGAQQRHRPGRRHRPRQHRRPATAPSSAPISATTSSSMPAPGSATEGFGWLDFGQTNTQDPAARPRHPPGRRRGRRQLHDRPRRARRHGDRRRHQDRQSRADWPQLPHWPVLPDRRDGRTCRFDSIGRRRADGRRAPARPGTSRSAPDR